MTRGLRDYRATDPAALREDLQRQNRSTEALLAEVRREKADRWMWRRVTSESATARFGEALRVATAMGAVKIRLPMAGIQEQGQSVIVALDGLGSVAVHGTSAAINGADVDVLAEAGAYQYQWDGAAWWRQPSGGGGNVADGPVEIVALAGAVNILDSGHARCYVLVAHGTATTLTVPADTFEIGDQITIAQAGNGQVTLAAGAGVAVRTAETLKLRKQWATCVLTHIAANEWHVSGDLELA